MANTSPPSTRRISPLIPRNQKVLVVCLILLSMADSVLVGYDSSLMGSLNVMSTYKTYFDLTTTTRSLNTAISFMGGTVAAAFAGFLSDWRGRKEAIFYGACVALIGGVIQGAAQNIGMFIAGRFIVGLGMGVGQVAAPTLIAETLPVNYRGFALGVYYSFWGVGTLIASGVCYGTEYMVSTWAWRIPSLLQAFPSFVVFLILLFTPESPRWLIQNDRHDEALEILVIANGSVTSDDPLLALQYREMTDTIAWEKGRNMSVLKLISLKPNRRRLMIAMVFSVIVMMPGNSVVTYYFGDMLTSAGVSDPTTQLQINVIQTAWNLVVGTVGSWCVDLMGRRPLTQLSLGLGVLFLFLLAAFSAVYGNSDNKSGIYATIAMIFLYNGSYNWGITPLTVLYAPEILSNDIRGVGMGIYTVTTKLSGLFVTMVVPFGLDAITWKVYIINACFDILLMVYVHFCFVETRGLTLEEVDKIFDGVKHSEVSDLAEVKNDKEAAAIAIKALDERTPSVV